MKWYFCTPTQWIQMDNLGLGSDPIGSKLTGLR
jgi:hypothetical protein